MMQIVECDYCGNSSLPFGNVSIDLTLRKSEILCKHCNNISNETQSLMFCTIGCLVEYMKEVIDGKRPLCATAM
jgi:hypothetical protein